MVTEAIALAVGLLVLVTEWLHGRRMKRVGRLAFGPVGRPRAWVRAVPVLRAVSLGMVVWGLLNLALLPPAAASLDLRPQGGTRHLVLALDVSPSMKVTDSGPEGKQKRSQRAGEVMMSILQRVAIDQIRISVVAFYTGALPVVIDTYDLDIVQNILNDLPLELAFEVGRTRITEGVREAFEVARRFPPASTTVIILSDGDTVPDKGMPEKPAAVAQVIVVGVGDPKKGTYIDGHQSRQDGAILSHLARRLGGVYCDVNSRHLPSMLLAELAQWLPMTKAEERGRRQASLLAVGIGALLLGGVPPALAIAGSPWQAVTRRKKPGPSRGEP